MSRFCGGDINFSGGFDELINSLANLRVLSLYWKWLYDQFLFWKEELTNSALFEEKEINTLLLNMVPYLCQIFRNWDTDNCKLFLRCVGRDTKWRYELFQDFDWNCLLIEREKTRYVEEEEGKEESESNIEACSTNTNLSLGISHSENFRNFFIKMNYLLDLFFPNNFQYALYKYTFGPDGEFSDYEITFPFPLIFSKKYFSTDERATNRTQKSKKDIEKGKEDKSKKKEKKLNLPVSPLAELKDKQSNKIDIENTILPLRMAYEVNDEFWKIIGKKIAEENPSAPIKEKGKIEEKEKAEGKTEAHAKDQKKEKKKGKK